jgi:transposase InsO family protein
MCGIKSFFSDLDEKFRQSVKLGDNSKMMVMGKGNIRLQVDGMTQVITEVYFALELKNNLLSVGQLHSHKRYLINFIDDYSRKTWVYFLSDKSEAFDVFKKFKALVEKETGNSICCLRNDRGGEFTSLEFNQFYSINGITRQLTASYTPQQNGVAERQNRTVMNMVCSMLSGKQIPKEFWSEAVN